MCVQVDDVRLLKMLEIFWWLNITKSDDFATCYLERICLSAGGDLYEFCNSVQKWCMVCARR